MSIKSKKNDYLTIPGLLEVVNMSCG